MRLEQRYADARVRGSPRPLRLMRAGPCLLVGVMGDWRGGGGFSRLLLRRLDLPV
jgi:hypothetical protein